MPSFPVRETSWELFPTRVLSLDFAGSDRLHDQIYHFFSTHAAFQHEDYLKHGDAINLLDLEGDCPALGRMREMFIHGLKSWLAAEQVTGDYAAELFMFSNFARPGEYTLVHNHARTH